MKLKLKPIQIPKKPPFEGFYRTALEDMTERWKDESAKLAELFHVPHEELLDDLNAILVAHKHERKL